MSHERPSTGPKVFPIVILADASGSMAQERKIDAVNACVRALIDACARQAGGAAEIEVGVVAFGGGGARCVLPLSRAASAKWRDLKADGQSPLGAAIAEARRMVEAKAATASGMARPLLVLISDGAATDAHWKAERDRLDARDHAFALRAAIAIGPDANVDELEGFARSGRQLWSRVIEPGSEPGILGLLDGLPFDLAHAGPDALDRPAPPDPATLG